MNRYVLVLLSAAFVLPAAAFAGDDHAARHAHAKPATAGAEAIWADGTVKKVDKAGGTVTINHGPLDNIGMSAMTMAFGVKDRAWLGKMKEGDRIRFVADYVGGTVTVVRYEPAR